MFTLVAATRYLLRWDGQGDVRSLAYAAVALGFSYLTRNEAAAAAAGAGLLWERSVSTERMGALRRGSKGPCPMS